MSPLKTSLVAAFLSIIMTAGGLYYFQQRRLREARHLQTQNNQMRVEANRRYQAATAEQAPRISSPTTVAEPGNLNRAGAVIPAQPAAEYYRNEGNATPLATLQTFAWACDRGDTDRVAQLLHIDSGARAKAEAYRASLPEKVRSQWRNVEGMAASILTRSFMGSPFPNADILETADTENITGDRVRLRLLDVPNDATEYQKAADGWKYVLTEAVVDRYLERMKERSAQAIR